MEVTVTAYTYPEVEKWVKSEADTIRFGEPHCYLKALRDWDEKNVRKACALIESAGKKAQLQLLVAPSSREEIGYTRNLCNLASSKKIEVVLGSLGMLEITNNSVAGSYIKAYNSLDLEVLSRQGVRIVSIAPDLAKKEIEELIRNAPSMLRFEYQIHGPVSLMTSWRCFLKQMCPAEGKGNCSYVCTGYIRMHSLSGEELFDVNGNSLATSRDLCMLPHLGELFDMGISIGLIETRNREYDNRIIDVYKEAVQDPNNFEYLKRLQYGNEFLDGWYHGREGNSFCLGREVDE